MLEITGEDVALLNDEDLRSLVGKLCESEMRIRGLSTSAVTWGGNQNAADGGIDVRVRIENGSAPGGFLPRSNTCIQVKKTGFTPGLIDSEMRPSGQLRASICSLIEERGAYIIASSGSDTSDSALKVRIDAMRSAIANHAGNENLYLDFYDRNRLATWTRSHAGLVVWVRQKIGRSIPGWQPYSSWAVSPDGEQDEYLLDDEMRLHAGASDVKGLDVTRGIERIRSSIREARGIVRIAGLSGVGKTRLVQALFDARVGSNPIDPSLAIYTNMSDNPSPQPTGMISDLIALRARAILVVDNCAPELHRRLTEICKASSSLVSVITVEYDVQEDEPEGTSVFRLEPSSVALVAKLIARHFPEMKWININRIADFSGGNARIAFVIANSLDSHESVAGLNDKELFKRIFQQRQENDDSLLKAAQACSLLYSFQGESLSGDDAELPRLALLAEMSVQQIFAKVSNLKSRELVQCRGVWRAVLPHAIANHLAKLALREFPLELIDEQLSTLRLRKSFSRRLGYLHESDEAVRLVSKWLSNGGLLYRVGQLNESGLAMLENIAPVSPESVLVAIEIELSKPNAGDLINIQWRRNEIARILRFIAYDESLFERCVTVMASLSIAEAQNEQGQVVEHELEGLFHLFLSGTHASIEQRCSVVRSLFCSGEPSKLSLGIKLLSAIFKTEDFSSIHSFEFGARVRDHGYWPSSRSDKAHWFDTSLQLARCFISHSDQASAAIRTIIAQSIRNLWFLGPGVQEQIEGVAEAIAINDYWQEGWTAVRYLLSHRNDRSDTEAMERLRALERRLRPASVIDQVRAVVLTQSMVAIDFEDLDKADDPGYRAELQEKAYCFAKSLGKVVYENPTVFIELLPDLVTGDAVRLTPFGAGLAIASADRRRTWEQLTLALGNTEVRKRNIYALCGFLSGLSEVDQQTCDALLEEAVTHEILGAHFPALQSSVNITAAGMDRLKRSAILGKAPARIFQSLGWSRLPENSSDDLRTILLQLAKQEHGFQAAIDILSMRFQPDGSIAKDIPFELIDVGRILLSNLDFNANDRTLDYHLHTLAEVCLCGAEGAVAATLLCERIKRGFADYSFHAFRYEYLLQTLFQIQPLIVLNTFFGNDSLAKRFDIDEYDFHRPSEGRKNPFDGIPPKLLLDWCDEDSLARYPAVSCAVSYCRATNDSGVEWTPLALDMLVRAPDPLAVLKVFVRRFYPSGWSGSRAAIVESRLELLNRLADSKSPSLRNYAKRILPKVIDDIVKMRKSENERDSARDERFE